MITVEKNAMKVAVKPVFLIVAAVFLAFVPVSVDAQEWTEIVNKTHLMDDSPVLGFELEASNEISDRLTSSTPRLQLSCSRRQARVDLLIDVSLEADENERHALQYRVGKQAFKVGAWPFRRDLSGLVATNPSELILSLRGEEKLVFELTPVGHEIEYAQFDLPDFTETYERLVAACGWVPTLPALDRGSYRNNRPKLNDGTVVKGIHVAVTVNAKGDLVEIDTLGASERVRTALMQVASRWAFTPGNIDGVAVEMETTIKLP